MGLLNKLTDTTLGLQGATPPKYGDSAQGSTLHNEYSLNGNPALPGKPTPSQLDLNGETPEQYISNLPG